MVKRLLVILGISGLISGLAYYLYEEALVVKSWDFKIVGLKLLNFSKDYIDVQLNIKIINISNIEAEISEISSQAYINDVYIGGISQTNIMAIPAKGYNILVANVRLKNKSFIDELLNFTSTGNPIELHVVGTLKVRSGFIAVRVPIDDTSTHTLSELIS